ncbi:MAG: hypothetical protein NTZ75_03225 [Euryarchaeota archaeon]|nr:hypothetical protein [Euryarchaeota archaeon]
MEVLRPQYGLYEIGDAIYLDTDQTLTGTVTVTFRYNPTDTMIGDSYTFQDAL